MNSRPFRWSISCWAQTAQRSPNSCSCASPVEPEPAQPDPRRPGHVVVDLGDRQAPLLAGHRLLGRPDDLRVHQHHRLLRLVLAGAVHDEDPLHHPELGRREPDARRLVHRRQHVGGQRPHARRRPPRPGSAALRRRGSGWIRIGRTRHGREIGDAPELDKTAAPAAAAPAVIDRVAPMRASTHHRCASRASGGAPMSFHSPSTRPGSPRSSSSRCGSASATTACAPSWCSS